MILDKDERFNNLKTVASIALVLVFFIVFASLLSRENLILNQPQQQFKYKLPTTRGIFRSTGKPKLVTRR